MKRDVGAFCYIIGTTSGQLHIDIASRTIFHGKGKITYSGEAIKKYHKILSMSNTHDLSEVYKDIKQS